MTAHAAPVNDLAGAVARWASERPDAPGYTVLHYHGRDCLPSTVTYARLHSATGALAARIRRVSRPGDRIAILCEHGIDYVVAFLACLYTARIAVPLFPASVRRHRERLDAALADARPAVGLVSTGALGVENLTLDTVLAVDADDATDQPDLDHVSGDIAYVQYTSGSTRSPMGVEVTHANLRAAMDQLRGALPAVTTGPIVTWLPFFHDMGLVLALSLPLYVGVPGVTLPPVEFAKRPIRWLRAVSDYRARVTASPNFGLALAVSATTAQERAGLDLSDLDLLLNGAEPVRAATLTAFTTTFSAYGFRRHAHTPGFGLAEATLPVTCAEQDTDPVTAVFDRTALSAGHAVVTALAHNGVPLVSCGRPLGQSVRIVDPTAHVEVPNGVVGEIWVAGPTVCAGYAHRPDTTARTFRARLHGSDENWLRTGDLGFRHNGQLFVAGRSKDIIVIDGRNHYPDDIEATVESATPEVRAGHVTAFGVDDSTRENLVVIAEVESELTDIVDLNRRIGAAVTATHDVSPSAILLVPHGQIPKTSSGKLRRGECRTRYQQGLLTRVTAAPPTDSPSPPSSQ